MDEMPSTLMSAQKMESPLMFDEISPVYHQRILLNGNGDDDSDSEDCGVFADDLGASAPMSFIRPVCELVASDVDPPNSGFVPTKHSAGSAGYDLRSPIFAVIEPMQQRNIPLNIGLIFPRSYMARIQGCSSLTKQGVVVFEGVVDADWHVGIWVSMMNMTATRAIIQRGQKIAQLTFHPSIAVGFGLCPLGAKGTETHAKRSPHKTKQRPGDPAITIAFAMQQARDRKIRQIGEKITEKFGLPMDEARRLIRDTLTDVAINAATMDGPTIDRGIDASEIPAKVRNRKHERTSSPVTSEDEGTQRPLPLTPPPSPRSPPPPPTPSTDPQSHQQPTTSSEIEEEKMIVP